MKKRIGQYTGVLYSTWGIIGQVQCSFMGIKYWKSVICFDSWKRAKEWLNE